MKTQHPRRTVAALAAIAAPVLLVAACGDSGGSGGNVDEDGNVTELYIVDYHNDEPNKSVWGDILDACGAEVGVTVNREAVPGAELITKVGQMSQAGELPDVLMLDNPDIQQIAATGALASLDDLGVDASGTAQGVLDAATYEGQLYAVQPITNSIGLFYNKPVLEAAGIEPPTTWDELKEAAAALTDGDQYGFAVSAVNTFEGTWQFLPFMWSNGGSETDIATPEVEEALQLWVDLLNDGSMSQSVVTWEQGDVASQFAAGNAAMMINGPWNFGMLDEVEGLEYGIVPTPTPDGSEPVSPFGGEAWTVPNTGNEATMAKAAEFVQCMISDEIEVEAAIGTNTVPTNPDLADQVVAANPNLEAFTQMVPTLRARTGELGPEWPTAATKIYEAFQNSLVNGVAPADALEQAQNG
ncbi:MAG: extracellular solute-binding protein [Beutenbergiaceae bacterium]